MYIPSKVDLFERPEWLAIPGFIIAVITGLVILLWCRSQCPSSLPRCLRPLRHRKYNLVEEQPDIELEEVVVDPKKDNLNEEQHDIELVVVNDPIKNFFENTPKIYGPLCILGSDLQEVFLKPKEKPSGIIWSNPYATSKSVSDNFDIDKDFIDDPTYHEHDTKKVDATLDSEYKTVHLTTPNPDTTSYEPKHITSKTNFLNLSHYVSRPETNSSSYTFPPFSDPSSSSSSDSEDLPHLDSLRRSKKRKAISSEDDEPDHWLLEDRHYLLPSLPVSEAEVIKGLKKGFTGRLPKNKEPEFFIYDW